MSKPDYIGGWERTPVYSDPPVSVPRRAGPITVFSRRLTLAQAANANLFPLVPGFHCHIIAAFCLVEEVTTDADADATIQPRVDGVDLTGGLITLADTAAAATASVVTLDKPIVGTQITVGSHVGPQDEIRLNYAVTNAFADGVVKVIIVVEASQN